MLNHLDVVPSSATKRRSSGSFALIGLAVLVGACCATRTGQLSGRWVAVAGAPTSPPSASSACLSGQAVGIAAPPSSGQPLLLKPSSGCFARTTLKDQFGDDCTETEREAAGSAQMSSDVPPDNVPTPGEVHWFCDRRTVVRVVLERCSPAANDFRIRQIALSVEKK